MVSLPVYDRAGKEVGKYEIDPAQIAPSINKQLLHDVVVMYQASRRMGTHKTKTRSEVRGTTKKMYRQKGTGNARAGSKQAAQRRGGGHVFALRNRDYSYRLPKKAIQSATRMAIATKLQSQDVIVLDELSLSAPKTKDVANLLKALQLQGVSLMLATEKLDPMVYKSARNIDRVTVAPVADLNALSVLVPKKLVVTRAALDLIRDRAKKPAKPA
ncbi:50S ribosomal protein L4 [Anatilimnocola sp. NA78]|uniref:50S ribosomal protein L4 n=1 Tax=Anatilimnocola sp. NA78 TaxID=3415683 RepID=UPI003CE5B172